MKRFLRKILLWLNLGLVLALVLSYLSNYISPAHIWVLAFFGLAYPFFLFANIVFVFLWWWRKRSYAFISLLVILAGWGNLSRYIQIPVFSKHSRSEKSISIMTYNVRVFNYYEWTKNGEGINNTVKFVSDQKNDISCLQEFVTINSNNKLNQEYIDSMFSGMPQRHISYTSSLGTKSNYGIATYSSLPIAGRGSIIFDESYNSSTFTDVVFETDTIRVFNVHLQSTRLRKTNYSLVSILAQKDIDEMRHISGRLKHSFIKRAEQVDQLSKAIRNSPYPVIVCGDFNDTPVSYTYQRIRGELADAYMESGSGIGITYRGTFPSYRIDYIFHSKSLKSANYRSIKVKYSDHYPVMCDLYLE